MYLNYDLAKALLDDRRAHARRDLLRRRPRPEPAPRPNSDPTDDAEVIELVFGRHCDTDQIGA